MTHNPHQNAITQLEQVAQILRPEYENKKLFDQAIEQLKTPDRVLEGKLKIKGDDGKTKTFQAYRSQHNNARGPYKGGIRFHPGVTKEEVMALSTWMTWKCAVTGIPYGGGKGGVVVDPDTLSVTELEALSRAYARFLGTAVGPWIDVPAPDVNTNGQIMAWMVDESHRMMTEQGSVPVNPLATFTGKPLILGGSEGREEATGLGGVMVLEQLMAKLDQRPTDTKIAIQGFGNVGYWFAYHAYQRGFEVVAISDSKGGVYVPGGLDPEKALEHKRKTKSLAGLGKVITNEALLELDVDVIVPAALENVITAENAAQIKAKWVIEMANGPVTPEADAILADRGVGIIADVLANAGGVSTSYFEWVQNLGGMAWSKDKVLRKLEPLMHQAFSDIWRFQHGKKMSGRMAAYVVAVKKVIDSMMIRGQIRD